MRLKILPYKIGSQSARALAQELGVLRIRSEGYRQRKELILNWGTSSPTQKINESRVLNGGWAVGLAADKFLSLSGFKIAGVPCPEFTTSRDEAARWLTEGHKVVCRAVLNGHSGRGITVCREGDTLPLVPLYTKYFKKLHEYRVHVFCGRVIDFTLKRKRDGYEDDSSFNPYVRSHSNGWVFCREGLSLPEEVARTSVQAVTALGLDFGAVDIGRAESGEVCVYEVNTAPGLEGTTLDRYVQAVKQYVSNRF